MSTAYLGLGSNVDAERHIDIAMKALSNRFSEVEFSPVYRSAAVGFDGDDFLNLAARIETDLEPVQLRDWLRELEQAHGRDRDAPKWSDRTLDIDILLYDDLVIYNDELEIPRREILKFAHVLKPLADIAPEVKHPAMHVSIGKLQRTQGLDESGLQQVDLGRDSLLP